MSEDDLHTLYELLGMATAYNQRCVPSRQESDFYILMAARNVAHRYYMAQKFPELVTA